MKPGRSKAKEVRDETNVRIKETDKYEEQREKRIFAAFAAGDAYGLLLLLIVRAS